MPDGPDALEVDWVGPVDPWSVLIGFGTSGFGELRRREVVERAARRGRVGARSERRMAEAIKRRGNDMLMLKCGCESIGGVGEKMWVKKDVEVEEVKLLFSVFGIARLRQKKVEIFVALVRHSKGSLMT